MKWELILTGKYIPKYYYKISKNNISNRNVFSYKYVKGGF